MTDPRPLLLSHRARLRAAAAMTSCQFARTRALQLLNRVNAWLRTNPMPGGAIAGLAGDNGFGPAIEDAIRDCEARPFEPLIDPREALEARKHVELAGRKAA